MEKIHYFSVGESFKKFLVPDPDAGDFQNLMGISLSKETSLVQIFVKI